QITGLTRPEAVRYDPDQDVWFVSNYGPRQDSVRDANGYISRVRPDGTIEELQFMMGTSAAPLHAPRGMIIRGDTLFVADADGVHGFDRRTGAHLTFIDMAALEPGFINDLAFDGNGVLYAHGHRQGSHLPDREWASGDRRGGSGNRATQWHHLGRDAQCAAPRPVGR